MLLRTAVLILLISPVHAAWPAEMDEFKIKAAMLYNFTKYVEWPPETGAAGKQLNVCITGNSPIKRHIDQLQGKQANGRTLAVRFVTSPDEISGCNMLFIDSSEYRRLSAFLQQGSRKPMLTVSDISQFASLGGMIGFFEQDDKIRFEINQDATLQAGITISSKLLKLARLVKGGK